MSTATLGQETAFGRHMKRWRRQRGLSQLDLAVRANLSQRHVSFIETGRSRPRADVAQRVAEALEVLIAWGERRIEAMELIELASERHPDINTAEELVPLVYRLKQGIEV